MYSCTRSPQARLSFYADAGRQLKLCDHYGKAGTGFRRSTDAQPWQPFVVLGDTLHYQFSAREGGAAEGDDSWGFRFHVTPVPNVQWMKEAQVLRRPALEWGAWMLQYLMVEAKTGCLKGFEAELVHNHEVAAALLNYIKSPNAPFKERVVRLLTGLLQEPERFNPDATVRTPLTVTLFICLAHISIAVFEWRSCMVDISWS